jgi:hypothetical protein
MISIKAYGGVLTVAAFASTLMLYGFFSKKLVVWRPIVLSLLISGLLLVSQLQPGSGSFIWQPGWFLKTMMESADRVNYPTWELQRQTYVFEHNIPRLIQLWLTAFLVFFIGNMGIRIFGLVSVIRDTLMVRKLFSYVTLFMLVIVVLGALLPLLLLQKGVVWNSIQFIYYTLFVMNIFTAMFIDSIANKKIRIATVITLVLLTLPTTIHTLSVYYKNYLKPDSYLLISHDELEALSFIKQLPSDSKVLADYHDTSYVSAMSGKSVYYADETQASILLLPLDRGDDVVRVFCHDAKAGEVKELMKDHDLTHVYTTKSDNADCVGDFENNEFMDKVFENAESAVYQLN